MAVRLIASDLDGTLFGADHVPEKRTVDAVNAAVDAGMTFVAITGRSHFRGAMLATSTGAKVHWFIGSNGGHRLNMSSGVLEERLVFDGEILQSVLRELPRQIGDIGFGHEHEGGFSWDEQFLRIHPVSVDGTPRIAAAKWSPDDVGKFFVAHPDVSTVELVELIRPHLPDDMHATTSGLAFVEITPSGGDKGSALQRLCTQLEIAADEVVAFGDNHNDLTMIEWAGRGIAMGNACDEVKAVADEVTATNVDFGVAMVVEAL